MTFSAAAQVLAGMAPLRRIINRPAARKGLLIVGMGIVDPKIAQAPGVAKREISAIDPVIHQVGIAIFTPRRASKKCPAGAVDAKIALMNKSIFVGQGFAKRAYWSNGALLGVHFAPMTLDSRRRVTQTKGKPEQEPTDDPY